MITKQPLQSMWFRESASKPHKINLCRFDLADIPPAPRGMPQIEVTFDIDANGILNVSAKDKATGKEQSIVIKASSGLSDEEIDAMVKDAEANAEEDKKFEELAQARNTADGLAHAAKKTLEEAGDKASDDEKSAIEAAIAKVEEAVQGDDKEAIDSAAKDLSEASQVWRKNCMPSNRRRVQTRQMINLQARMLWMQNLKKWTKRKKRIKSKRWQGL